MNLVSMWIVLERFLFLVVSDHLFPGTYGTYLGMLHIEKSHNRNTRKRWEMLSKLKIKTPERPHWRHSGVIFVNLERLPRLLEVNICFETFQRGLKIFGPKFSCHIGIGDELVTFFSCCLLQGKSLFHYSFKTDFPSWLYQPNAAFLDRVNWFGQQINGVVSIWLENWSRLT